MYSEDTARKAAASRYLPAATAYVIMDPNHPESLMHVPIQLILMCVNALVSDAATLNFIRERFAEAMI